MKTLITYLFFSMCFIAYTQTDNYSTKVGSSLFAPKDGVGPNEYLIGHLNGLNYQEPPFTKLNYLCFYDCNIDSLLFNCYDSSYVGFNDYESVVYDDNWIGHRVYYNSTYFNTINANNDTLLFNFDLGLGDSSLFCTINNLNYYVKLNAITLDSVFGNADSVKHFSILSYDLQNTAVSNSFSANPISISKTYGITSFINTNFFPDVQKEFELIGLAAYNTLYGDFPGLTKGDLYPWQAGDTLQFTTYTPGAPLDRKENRITYLVKERTETGNIVTIKMDKQVQYWWYINGSLVDSNASTIVQEISYPSTFQFNKTQVMYSGPKHLYDFNNNEYSLDTTFIAGEPLRKYGKYAKFLAGDYCSSTDQYFVLNTWHASGTFNTYVFMEKFGQVRKATEYYPDIYTHHDTKTFLNFANVGVSRRAPTCLHGMI